MPFSWVWQWRTWTATSQECVYIHITPTPHHAECYPVVTMWAVSFSNVSMSQMLRSEHASLSVTNGLACGQASPHRLPRLIYCLNMNILLVSRVYGCCNEHHPGMLNQLSKCGLESSIPFVLWHQNGFSLQVMEHIQQLISSGMSLQECESSLAENRLWQYYFSKKKMTNCYLC